MLKKLFKKLRKWSGLEKRIIKELTEELTAEQKKHLVTIEWLINFEEHIRQGRTRLLAIAFIKRALMHRDEWIEVFDHYPTPQAKNILLSWIGNVISKDKELSERTEFKQSRFKIRKLKTKKKIRKEFKHSGICYD